MEFQNKYRLYKYTLINPSFGKQPLYSAPKGWVDQGFNIKRSSDYYGMFREFSEQVVTFVKEGRRFLLKVLENEGIEGTCQYIVERYNKATYEYEDYFSGYIDFSTKLETRKTFECKIIDSQFEATIRNREDIAVQLFDLMSIDQQEMVGYTNEGEFVRLAERTDFLFSTLNSDKDTSYQYTGFEGVAPLLKIISQEDENVRENEDSPGSSLSAFFNNTTGESIEIEINGSADFVAELTQGNLIPKVRVYNNDNSLNSEINLDLEEEIISSSPLFGVIRFYGDFSLEFEMPASTYLVMYLDLEGSGSSQVSIDAPLVLDFTIKTETATIVETTILGMRYHEAGNRIVQSYTNTQNAFYSELLGCTDSEPRQYASDGDMSLGMVLNGKLIRGFNTEESVLSASWKDFFESISKNRCACFTVEEIDGQKVARIEEMKYAFDDRIILTIENAKDIGFEYGQDWAYNKIDAGYDKSAYEERNGLLEYNNKSEYSTFIKSIKNDLDLVVPFRADNEAFSIGRKLPKKDFPTTDSDIDEDNFMLDLVRNETPTEVINGDFEQPFGTDWQFTGVATRTELLGSNRAFLNNTPSELWQDIVTSDSAIRVFRFSYQLIGTYDNFPPLITDYVPMLFRIELTDGVDTYYALNDGSWQVEENTINYTSLLPVDPFSLQSFLNYELTLNALPVTGTITIKFLSAPLDPFGNVRNAFVVIDDVFLAQQARFRARTNEGFDYIKNTLNNDKSFNIRYSPGHILRNWGKIIRSSLEKYTSSFLVYNTSDKNSQMISKETGEPEIAENTNVLVNDLDESFFLPEVIKFNAPVGNAEISAINSNFASDGKPKKYGIIKVRDELNPELYYYGWIVNVNSGAKREEKTWELLMVNTNNITPYEE